MVSNIMIDPASVAFDFDGVVADTMSLFLNIASVEYNIDGIGYDDITTYNLEECLSINPGIIDEIINKILEGDYSLTLQPMAGISEVLVRIARYRNPIPLVTSRPHPGPINDWIKNTLPLDPAHLEVVATGTFDGKADELLNRKISYFVEDRLETCFFLKDSGIIPVLFRQPWNRRRHPFLEVANWREISDLIHF
ncbi:MAG: haloacid dehalogenase [Deltaproteobacteria bacterium]|nr:MAG: haloacid dehalogenase [Deltaproteobacteria bacterium]